MSQTLGRLRTKSRTQDQQTSALTRTYLQARAELRCADEIRIYRERDCAPWYRLRGTPDEELNSRLAELKKVYDQTQDSLFTLRTAQALFATAPRGLPYCPTLTRDAAGRAFVGCRPVFKSACRFRSFALEIAATTREEAFLANLNSDTKCLWIEFPQNAPSHRRF